MKSLRRPRRGNKTRPSKRKLLKEQKKRRRSD